MIRTYIRRSKTMYPLLRLLYRRGWGVVTQPNSQIVIEGFPRCGNSFAEAAFRTVNGDKSKIAHHCHAAAQVLLALDWNIPSIVLFRNPVDAISSLVQRNGNQDAATMYCRDYESFYNALEVHIENLYPIRVQNFERYYPALMRSINRRHNTSFGEKDLTVEMRHAIFQKIDLITNERQGRARVDYSPSAEGEEATKRRERRVEIRKCTERVVSTYNGNCLMSIFQRWVDFEELMIKSI